MSGKSKRRTCRTPVKLPQREAVWRGLRSACSEDRARRQRRRSAAAGDARARARRYKALHGKFVLHPLDGRRVPIITDAVLVDMAFGTGAVKITPAHDPNDFEAGLRHRGEGVEFINILADDGTINGRGGRFAGQPRFQARAQDRRVFCDWV